MAMHRNEWRPDTCDCVLEYEFDDELPQEERQIIFRRVIHPCELHDKEGIGKPVYDKALEENQRKNLGIKAVVETFGAEPKDWKVQPQDVEWRFDKDRNVLLKLPEGKINAAERSSAANSLTKFNGKVSLE